jgi:SOS-response transcriptional repressor LexA
VYQFLLDFLLEHQRQPTVREMMRHFGYLSPNAVFCHLSPLTKKGWLTWENNAESGQRRWKLVGIKLKAETCESSARPSLTAGEAQEDAAGAATGAPSGSLIISSPEGWVQAPVSSTSP